MKQRSVLSYITWRIIKGMSHRCMILTYFTVKQTQKKTKREVIILTSVISVHSKSKKNQGTSKNSEENQTWKKLVTQCHSWEAKVDTKAADNRTTNGWFIFCANICSFRALLSEHQNSRDHQLLCHIMYAHCMLRHSWYSLRERGPEFVPSINKEKVSFRDLLFEGLARMQASNL